MNLKLLCSINIDDADFSAMDVVDAIATEIEAGRVVARTEGDIISGLQYISIQQRWPITLPTTVA
jgi:hypothetical protein